MTGISALIVALLAAEAPAADLDLVLHEDRLTAPERTMNGYFGNELAGAGDLNHDGFADVVISEYGANRVYVYLGTPQGLDLTNMTTLEDPEESGWYFGTEVAGPGDLDGDGYDDLALGKELATGVDGGAVYLFAGGPSGVDPVEMVRLLPVSPTGTRSDYFGKTVSGGDIDADGFADLVVGASGYHDDEGVEVGAAYVYYGTTSGIDPETEVLLLRDGGKDQDNFGWRVAFAGDTDGDGGGEVAVTCYGSTWTTATSIDYYPCATVYLYPGGDRALDTVEPSALQPGDNDWEDYYAWNHFGWDLTHLDHDGDGYEDLVVGTWGYGGFYVYPGGATGVSQESETVIRHADPEVYDYFGIAVAGVGDVDGDGEDDLLVGASGEYFDTMPDAFLFYGGAGGLSWDASLTIRAAEPVEEDSFGWGVAGAGDVDADGHADLLIGATYDGKFEGAAYLFRPVCNWYADADGDGYGDPTSHVETCDPQGDGWAHQPDDCDDTDPNVHGDTWYTDGDGDGYGTTAGAVLACEQPYGTSTTWLDCDDSDPTVYPGAPETDGDGIDQDCDGTPEEVIPGDTGSGDTGATVDTGPGPDTGPATDTGPPASDPDDTGTAPRDRRCGCTAGSAPRELLMPLLLLGLALARRRARLRADWLVFRREAVLEPGRARSR